MCRGAFFNMLEDRARVLGPEVVAEYLDFFKVARLQAWRMYPLRDYLTRLVVLSQIRFGADGIHAGLRELQSGAFDAWGATMLGRAALRVADPTLEGILRLLERAYASHTVVTHTTFKIEHISPDEVVTRFENEYVYIEHAMAGALEGVMRVCGYDEGRVVAELETPYVGRVRLMPGPRRAKRPDRNAH